MKRKQLLIVAALLACSASAQQTTIPGNRVQQVGSIRPEEPTLVESKTFDNFYIGVGGGISAMTFYSDVHRHLNPNANLRIGRDFTPVFGLAVEGNLYLNDEPWGTIKTVAKYVNTGVLTIINLSNWFGGYGERPRAFEVDAVVGLGWGHAFGHSGLKHSCQNDVTSKTGFSLAWNPGRARAWKLYLEPAMTWNILDGAAREEGVQFNYKKSFAQLNIGVCYRFRNSNGLHHIKRGGMGSTERYTLERQVKNLFSELDSTIQVMGDAQYTLDRQEKTIEMLQQQNDSISQAANDIRKQTWVLPVMVVFKQGSSEVDEAQMPNLQLIANYMKQHPSAVIEVRGYATPDADLSDFRRMAEARAGSVTYLLTKRFGVNSEHLRAVGGGITNELFDQAEFNRIVTFKVLK